MFEPARQFNRAALAPKFDLAKNMLATLATGQPFTLTSKKSTQQFPQEENL